MTPLHSAPRCCGASMREVTDPDERPRHGRCWICCRCYRQQVEATSPPATGRHARDPRLRCIRQRRRRWEVRIAGGRRGVHLRVGLFLSLEAAIAARDRAERQRRAA